MKVSLNEILKNKNKYKNKFFLIGMAGLSLEDIIKYQNIFDKNDLFEIF